MFCALINSHREAAAGDLPTCHLFLLHILSLSSLMRLISISHSLHAVSELWPACASVYMSVSLTVCLFVCLCVCMFCLSLSFWPTISLSARLHNTKEQSATNELLSLRQQLPSRLRTRALVRPWQRQGWRQRQRRGREGVDSVEEGQWQAQVMHMDRVTWLNF